MTPESRKTWCRAHTLIEERRDDALLHAALAADWCLDHNDFDGAKRWKQILAAIKQLQSVSVPTRH